MDSVDRSEQENAEIVLSKKPGEEAPHDPYEALRFPDFRLLVDLGRLESMDLACVPELGRAMEMVDAHGVGLVVRVIPDPGKDIGFNILTIFHYTKRPQIVAHQDILDAGKSLSL